MRPMPSPNGTNRERLFIGGRNPAAAYDSAIADPAAGHEILAYCRDKLSPEDLAALAKLLGVDPDSAMDVENLEPRGGYKPAATIEKIDQAHDARRRARPMSSAQQSYFEKRFPQVARIGVV
jgi:hypothetical protein